ncbi:MAG: prolyl oligopeptidase family serine peptidase, partial [Bacteroidales bacterium]|nr:prolyl oligopeptidase family serine peptidase [Bacteroidales bacterium]
MKKIFTLLVIVALFACNSKPKKPEIVVNYPETKKVDTVDTYFGVQVADPYRWLEDDLSDETAEWVKAENKVTFDYLNQIPFREKIKQRLEKLWNYEKVGSPKKHGDYYYFYKNDGLQNQYVLYRKKDLATDEAEVFIDPNKFSEDGTISMAGTSFTKDGSLMAYLISEGGSDWRKIIVKNTETGEMVEDTLIDVKFSGVSWKGNEGFYYSSYDKPKDGSQLSGKTQFHKLFYHKLGTPQKQDILIFGGDKQPRRYIGGGVTEDQNYLIISAAESTTGNELYVQDISSPGKEIKPVVTGFENDHYIVDNEGERFLIHTNLNAPNNRLVEVNINNPVPENWKDVIPETENVLEISTAGGSVFASYMVDVKSKIMQYNYSGKLIREVELPSIGTAGGFGGEKEDTELYYNFTSFTYPGTIFKYEIASGKSEMYWKPAIDFNPEDYLTEQVFYQSKDSTKIPMFITYKKGMKKNGKNPTYLYAYGGFNISLMPSFSIARLVWLENGGIYAQPNLRGGGEYGEKWHKAGTKMQKQNVFDDFIAAAEYLKDNKYTSTDYLAIAGGSNGGLLVGATITQRPDLAAVAFPAVGVLDMLRYHKFTAGAGWTSD